MSPSSGATIRADLNTVVEEASAADKFFIGHLLLPELGVDAKSGTYAKLTKTATEHLKPNSTIRERSSGYGEIKRSWTSENYATIDRGLEEAIDDTDVKDTSRFFDLESLTARFVYRAMRLDHEIRVKDEIFSTTNFAATNSAVAYTEANLATIDFVQDLQEAIERVNDNAEEPNTVVMSPDVYNRLRRSTLLKNFLVGQNLPIRDITPNAIQQAFSEYGIQNVYVGRARYDSAKKGQSFSSALVWPNTYVWVGKVASGEFANGGVGRTLVWNKEGGLFVTETYRDEKRRSNMVRVRQHTDEAMVDTSAGTLITTQYA